MSASGGTRSSRCVKTQHGVAPYHSRHFSGRSSSRSWAYTHSYVVAPIAIAATPAKNGPNPSTPLPPFRGTSNSHSRELSSSAMNPSTLVAVKYCVFVTAPSCRMGPHARTIRAHGGRLRAHRRSRGRAVRRLPLLPCRPRVAPASRRGAGGGQGRVRRRRRRVLGADRGASGLLDGRGQARGGLLPLDDHPALRRPARARSS